MLCKVSNRVYVAEAYPTDLLAELRAPGYTPPTPKFRAGILRTGKGTVLLYANGKAVVNGCKRSTWIRHTVTRCFLTLGISLATPRLVNIVAYAKTGHPVNLANLHRAIPKSIYEPELHCGLLFYVARVSVIVYHTGVVLICGSKSYSELKYVAKHLGRKFINSPTID